MQWTAAINRLPLRLTAWRCCCLLKLYCCLLKRYCCRYKELVDDEEHEKLDMVALYLK